MLDTRDLVVGDEVLPMTCEGPLHEHYTGTVQRVDGSRVTVQWEVGGKEIRERDTLWRCPRKTGG